MSIEQLIPTFGGLATTAAAFVLALSVIVFIHEYGHYIVGRWCGIQADVFSLGFGPVLFSRYDRRGTRWQIAAVPLGGYVRFSGDGDAASARFDKRELSHEEHRKTLYGAPLWARTLTVAAGPLFNFISAMIIFCGIALFSGVAVDEAKVGGLVELPSYRGDAQQNELRIDDLIVAVDGHNVDSLATFARVSRDIEAARFVSYRVMRDGDEIEVWGPHPLPALAGGVSPQTPASDAGLKTGDVIVSVDGQDVYSFEELRDIVGASNGAELTFRIWRDGRVFEQEVTPRSMDMPTFDGDFETRWLIGVTGSMAIEPQIRMPSLFEAVKYGFDNTQRVIVTSLSGLWHIVTGAISSCNLRGPLGIAEGSAAAASLGVTSFVSFIAVLSVAIGIMNLFPIPVLDGGHLVFYAYEAIARKPPAEKVVQVIMSAGFVFLIAVMMFSLSNDVFCP